MGKLQKIGRVWDCLFLPTNQCSCFCLNTLGDDDEEEHFEKKPLIDSSTEKSGKVMRLKDVVAADHRQTLAFHLKPKVTTNHHQHYTLTYNMYDNFLSFEKCLSQGKCFGNSEIYVLLALQKLCGGFFSSMLLCVFLVIPKLNRITFGGYYKLYKH